MKKFKIIVSIFLFGIIVFSYGKLQAQESNKSKAVIQWDEKNLDIGKVKTGESKKLEFSFKNTGDIPVVISSVKPTCGCTLSNYPKQPINPGESGKITATYKASGIGEFRKSIRVYSNADPSEIVLIFKGTVVN